MPDLASLRDNLEDLHNSAGLAVDELVYAESEDDPAEIATRLRRAASTLQGPVWPSDQIDALNAAANELSA